MIVDWSLKIWVKSPLMRKANCCLRNGKEIYESVLIKIWMDVRRGIRKSPMSVPLQLTLKNFKASGKCRKTRKLYSLV